MPLETDNDDYLKYFFDESIPLFQRLNTIIKKGDPIQKQALLSKLVLYQSTDLFKSLMEYILNEIGTWDKETITLFPRYLYPLFKTSRENLIKSIDNELFNLILKKFILTISSTEEHISREYMIYFEKIIEHFNEEKNEKNESFPYSIEESIFNDIISLGKFDETLLNKQLSCCLCCSFIRLINDVKNKNVQNLFNRVCFLFSYCEKEIETQLSRELEFLFPIFKQNLLENSDISRSVDSYLSRDSDFVLQSITIISILRNLHLIKYCELIEKLIGKIKEIFTDEGNFEQGNKNRIFLELIKSLEKNYKKMDIKILKKLFEDNFISNFIINNKEQNIIIENFDVIVFIFDHMVNELTVNTNLVLEESNFEITNKEEKDKEKEKENHMMTEEEFETKLKEVLEEKRIRKNHKITKDKLKEIFEAIYEKDFILPELPEDPKDEEENSKFDAKEESKRFLNEIFFKLARSLDYDDEIKPSEIKEYISPKRVQEVVGEIVENLIDVMGHADL